MVRNDKQNFSKMLGSEKNYGDTKKVPEDLIPS